MKDQYWLRDEVAQAIHTSTETLKSAAIWIQDEAAKEELLEATKYISQDRYFSEMLDDYAFRGRAGSITRWIESLCEDLLADADSRSPLPRLDEYRVAWEEAEAIWADHAASYEAYLEEQNGENAKQARQG